MDFSLLKKYIIAIFLLNIVLFTGCASGKYATIATYNIHVGKGLDRKYDLNRIAEAIRAIGAETIVLNEVDVKTNRSNMDDQPAILAEKLGMNYAFGMACNLPDGTYGNAVLSVYKVEKIDLIDIPASRRESRSALVVKIHAPKPYYVIATHFAFERKPEIEAARIKSVDLLADYMREKKYSPFFFCGDFNVRHNSAVIRRVQSHGIRILNDISGKMLSYPSGTPKKLLDYRCVYPANSVKTKNVRVINTQASDHRPVAADFLFE